MKPITYKLSGVDIDQANTFVKSISPLVSSTANPNVLKCKGAFGSLFALEKKYKHPVLVSSTDGVGTKLLIAQQFDRHDTVGIDLVAMNINDILCMGAKPLFFLDYIACGKVDVKVLKSVMKGITRGCREAGCALVGGETAEMPGMYKPNEYDLAGFAVGIVDRNKIINGAQMKAGDQVIGLPSSGLHSNGFSLARKVLSMSEQRHYLKDLLTPTRIYVKEVFAILEKFSIKGIAHLTGGAFYEKLIKILPDGMCFKIHKGSWPVPKIFEKIQKNGKIQPEEMYRTFNMGIGLALVFDRQKAFQVSSFLKRKKIAHYSIGEVVEHPIKKVIFEDLGLRRQTR